MIYFLFLFLLYNFSANLPSWKYIIKKIIITMTFVINKYIHMTYVI